MGGLISFLSGSIFRTVWGEISSFVTKNQDHKQSIELLNIEAKLGANKHAQDIELIATKQSLGISNTQNQVEVITGSSSADAWVEAGKGINTRTGVEWVDGWNQAIRPGVATIAVFSMIAEIIMLGHLTDWHREVFSAALGIYLADRTLTKRGK